MIIKIIIIIILIIILALIISNIFKSNYLNLKELKGLTLLGGNDPDHSKQFVISGDIHGNKEQYNLFKSYIDQGYRGIYLGDFTQEHNNHKHNRTDFSKEMYELVKSNKVIWLCGNHDILQYYTTKLNQKSENVNEHYPDKFQKAIDWAEDFKEDQKYFIKCFDEKLIKFKLLLNKDNNILPEDADPEIVDKCFSHWVINKSTPIQTTNEMYDILIKKIDESINDSQNVDKFDSWFDLYKNIWTRSDKTSLRIYKNHYVGHSMILMLSGTEITDRLNDDDKFKVLCLTYLSFKAFWPSEIDHFINDICNNKYDIEYFEEAIKNIDYANLVYDCVDIGYNKIEGLHLCDVHPDVIEFKLQIKNDEISDSLPNVFII